MDPSAFAQWAPRQERTSVDYEVRPAALSDLDRCVELAATIGADDRAAWRETFIRAIGDEVERALFVAEAGDGVVGYARVVHLTSDGDPSAFPEGWYLLGVVVDPRWRRGGIGEALTRIRMQWTAIRADHVYYFAHADNRASEALHERMGFTPVSEEWTPPDGVVGQQLYVARLGQ